jgi:hypothetical protein
MPGIWSVAWPAGGKPELVLRFDDPVRQPYRPYWTLSRDRLFVLLQESESDVWLVETEGMQHCLPRRYRRAVDLHRRAADDNA